MRLMGKARLSMAFSEMAGSADGVVLVRGRSGLVVQRPKSFRRAISPAQAEAMARMERAGRAWNELDEEQVEAWRSYSKGLRRTGSVSGKEYHPVAFNVFSGLYCKRLQIDPASPIPAWPPFGPFLGDDVEMTVSPLPLPPFEAEPLGAGALVYSASGPNAPGVLTEILYQKLPGKHRLPRPAYKSGGFASFQEGDLTYVLPVEKGWYACAYAFVEAATGRTTAVFPLGTVTVA